MIAAVFVLCVLSLHYVCGHQSQAKESPKKNDKWQIPSSSHFFHTATSASAHQKRSFGPQPHGNYSTKPISRQWNEVLLSSIRRDKARPTTHARNLFHFAVSLYEAWRVFHAGINGVVAEPILASEPNIMLDGTAAERDAATEVAMAYSCSQLLRHRFKNGTNEEYVLGLIDQQLMAQGLDPNYQLKEGGTSPADVGIRIGRQIIEAAKDDGSCEELDYECQKCETNSDGQTECKPFYEPVNQYPLNPYWNGPGIIEDPNRWQRLEIGQFIDQAGVAINGYPPFTGPQWGYVTPFALTADDRRTDAYGNYKTETEGVYFDPGEPPRIGTSRASEFRGNFTVTAKCSGMLSPDDGMLWNQSPADSHLGSNNHFAQVSCDLRPDEACKNLGVGWDFNPSTFKPYSDNTVFRGDYTRVLAEFWADGPQSETPPGHWNTILNAVMDHPEFEYRWAGRGPLMDPLEWEVKAYLALNGGVHDAAIAAWGVKNHYDYARPISAIRWMSSLGQSTYKNRQSYNENGLPIVFGHSRLISPEDICTANCGNYTRETARGHTAGRFGKLGFEAINQTAIRSWEALMVLVGGGVTWQMGQNWRPYQRPSFTTPPFAGYVSGHSTFSRTAAEMLTYITGTPFFPGGLGRFTAPKNDFLVFENGGGPSQDVEIQWATYGDAADECSLSRIYGGIHPPADDAPGRRMGRMVARRVWGKILEVIGKPTGYRHQMRVTFSSSVAEQFGSEEAASSWAQALAARAHRAAADEAGEDADTGAGGKYEGMTVLFLPRNAGEGVNDRRVVVLGAHENAGVHMREMAAERPGVAQAFLFDCDEVTCDERGHPQDPARKIELAHNGINQSTLLLIVVLGAMVCLAIVALFYVVVQDDDEVAEEKKTDVV